MRLLGQRLLPPASHCDLTSLWTRKLRSVWAFEVVLASEVRRFAQRRLHIRNRVVDHCTVGLAAVIVLDILWRLAAAADPSGSAAAEQRLASSPTDGSEPEIDEDWKEHVLPELRVLFASAVEIVRVDLVPKVSLGTLCPKLCFATGLQKIDFIGQANRDQRTARALRAVDKRRRHLLRLSHLA